MRTNMTKKTKKKTAKEMIKPVSISISFTREEVDWLAWVVRDVLETHQCVPAGESACDKIINAEGLLKDVEKVLHEGTKVRKVDSRKRQAPRARRKGARR
jgi:hypothetical protein